MKNPPSYISTHLLTVLTLCFIAGIWYVPSLSPHFNVKAPATITFILLFLFAAALFQRRKPSYVLMLLPVCTLLVGYLHGLAHFQLPASNQHIYNLVQTSSEVILTGNVKEMVSYDGKMSKAVLELSSLRRKDQEIHQPTHGLVRLSILGKWPAEILPGDQLVVRANLKRPRSFHTPGAFDYARFLAQKDIWITGFIPSPLFIKKLNSNNSLTQKYKYFPEKVRTHITTFLDHNLEPRFASIYRALLVGDRSSVSSSDLELFKASGTFHILAISGLHIAVIATLLYFIFYWLLSRSEYLLLHFPVRKIVAVLTIPILFGYALLAGMNSPVTRAVIMSSIVLIALCTDRKKSPAPLVAAAAGIILIFEPQQLFTVSFQLSFSAIIGILFILPILQKIILGQDDPEHKATPFTIAYKYTLSALLVSVTATLATAPIIISTFNRISTIGPLANLILEPLICLWCLPAGIIALPFMLLSPETANLFLHFGSYGISAALFVAELLTAFPLASIFLPDPSSFSFIVFYLFLIYLWVSGFAINIKYRKKTAFIFLPGLLLFILIFSVFSSTSNRQRPKISFIDVGQGSSTLIESGDKTVLIDGGGSSYSHRSVGETVIAPFLWDKGLRTIDTIIITHPDSDHYNGLGYILDHFSPRLIWVRDLHGHDHNYKTFIGRAQKKGVNVTIPEAGDILHEDDIILQCLTNLKDQKFKNTRSGGSANSGLILKGCLKGHCFLFPGDINTSMEEFLLQQGVSLKADTLLSAHHGSKTSNSTKFLTAVSPQHTIVSAATSKRGYFPHQSFLDKCKAQNIEVLNTSQDGTIEFEMTNNNTAISTTRKFQENPLYPFVFMDIEKDRQKN